MRDNAYGVERYEPIGTSTTPYFWDSHLGQILIWPTNIVLTKDDLTAMLKALKEKEDETPNTD